MTTDTTVEKADLAEATALTISRDSGMLALATMTEQDFAARLAALKVGRQRVEMVQRELMDKKVDYGVIPGTDKPTLLKPGAEKLCLMYGLVATFDPVLEHGDGETQPDLRVLVTCTLHQGSLDGPVVARASDPRTHGRRGIDTVARAARARTVGARRSSGASTRTR